jgi:hypothetical protein
MAEQDTHPNSALLVPDANIQQQDSQEHLIDSENVSRILTVPEQDSGTQPDTPHRSFSDAVFLSNLLLHPQS